MVGSTETVYTPSTFAMIPRTEAAVIGQSRHSATCNMPYCDPAGERLAQAATKKRAETIIGSATFLHFIEASLFFHEVSEPFPIGSYRQMAE